MARVKALPLGRPHQLRMVRHLRRLLHGRGKAGPTQGVVLADAVGLGKTYEALATVATLLSLRGHARSNRRRKPFHVLVVVPPRLMAKWEDELRLPDRFPRYLEAWRGGETTQAVWETFHEIAVLRRASDLEQVRAQRKRRREALPGGLYLVNDNLLRRQGRRASWLHRTSWDAIVMDEAHHRASDLLHLSPHELLRHEKTATLLLTATPFQLHPGELEDLLASTFGGYGSPRRWGCADDAAGELYDHEEFREYRAGLDDLFESGGVATADKNLRRRKAEVEGLLRPRVARSAHRSRRVYNFVDGAGDAEPVEGDLFALSDGELRRQLEDRTLVRLDAGTEARYLRLRASLAGGGRGFGPRPFVAGTLRQFLSSHAQFRASAHGSTVRGHPADEASHPKVAACVALVRRLMREEISRLDERGWVGKTLVFTCYVGEGEGERRNALGGASGTASALKRSISEALEAVLEAAVPAAKRKGLAAEILARLRGALDASDALSADERSRMRRALGGFAGRPLSRLVLSRKRLLDGEVRVLRQDLDAIRGAAERTRELEGEGADAGVIGLAERHRATLVERLTDRYSTRDLVARYDGGTDAESRARYLRSFNSPFAPLVLIASAVGQEGVDLQKYCLHVVHHDLEWNPAKMEQREGRVDRQGRASKEPVKVYLLVCRGTYDERVLFTMVHRSRWHRVLFHGGHLQRVPEFAANAPAPPGIDRRLALDLRPR